LTKKLDFIAAAVARKTFELPRASACFENSKRWGVILMPRQRATRRSPRAVAKPELMQQRRHRQFLLCFLDVSAHVAVASFSSQSWIRPLFCSMSQTAHENGVCRMPSAR
jgi:hypothetical protein